MGFMGFAYCLHAGREERIFLAVYLGNVVIPGRGYAFDTSGDLGSDLSARYSKCLHKR